VVLGNIFYRNKLLTTFNLQHSSDMIFSYNWLQDYIKEKLPKPEKLTQILTMHFAEVEEVKKREDDFVLDIDVRPNRAGDCFSHLGIAREIAAITKSKFQTPDLKIKEEKNKKAKDFVKVEVKDKKACPRYTAKVVFDVKVGPSPKWLKKRLAVCGFQSVNNIVDISNYVMLETGQPLHAFDLEKLKGGKIIVRFSKKGEKITTLDEQKFNLNKNILVIADKEKPVAIAGIKGGKGPEIDNNTKNVVLESANFDSRVIHNGSQLLKLKTDASLRFEHGIDPNLTEKAINRAAQLIQDLALGKVAKGLVDRYPQKINPAKINLGLEFIEKLLGIKIPKKEVIRILESLGFKIKILKPDILEVEVPTIRVDISMAEDLIEEIGRIWGYGKIPFVFPKASLIPAKRNLEIFWEEFSKDVLKEAGFTEVYNYSFINKETGKIFGYKEKELIEVENPTSLEYQYLCPSLIPNLFKNTKENFKNFDEIRIFELGKIFRMPKNKVKSPFGLEKRVLTGLIAKKGKVDYFCDLKGVIDILFEKMGIPDSWCDSYKPSPQESKKSLWKIKKCAEIKVQDKEIGFLGEISSKILDDLKIKGTVFLFDLDFDKLQNLATEEHEYRPVSPYPAAIRDLAVLVPSEIQVEQVLNVINQAGGKLVQDVDLFDIYEGGELPQGKKNLAFHIIYQAEDRTLTSKEIDKIHNKIVNSLEKNPEWEVRR